MTTGDKQGEGIKDIIATAENTLTREATNEEKEERTRQEDKTRSLYPQGPGGLIL